MKITLRQCICAAVLASGAASMAAPATPRYANPLALQLADGTPADNCADPALIAERDAATPSWYLFCTTDPIDRRERDGAGWRFRLMPVFRSDDLLNWRHAGDAFSALPAMAAPKAGLWAPEPVYLNGRYHLYFAITDVIDSHSPEPGCDKDSAIAVATSTSPAGPWKVEEQPVVAPRRAGPGCQFHWTIDPEVIQEGGRNYLYYGSYGGGMFVQPLDKAGLRAEGAPVRVGADGRYEGAEVVKHGGKWYLFASATDCCNGPLTGYALFVGRADSPLGPFLDRHGRDMAAARAGGTPVLAQNGNRWVGPGHNTVFQDGAGLWWTIYHAIDREQPFFSARDRLTRRVVLLDRIDWIDGWPVIAGGAGPSESMQAGPGSNRPRAAPLAEPRAAALWRERFRAGRPSARWRWLRAPADLPRPIGDGLRLRTQAADLHVDTNNAGVLSAALPERGNYRVELRVRLDVPDTCCDTPVQAGLVVYRDDDNYVKLVDLAHRGLRQVEFAKEVFPVDQAYPRYGNTVVGAPGQWTWLRMDVQRFDGHERYTAYSSQNGRDWERGGSWTHQLGRGARVGLVAMGGAGRQARFAHVAVSRLP